MATGNWLPFFRPLAVALKSNDAAILFSELCDKQEFYEIRNELDSSGYFYLTVESMKNYLNLSYHKQSKCINQLVEAGLLETIVKGQPAKRHFRIPSDIDIQFSNFLKTSFRENRILVFEEIENQFLKNSNQVITNRERPNDQNLNEKFAEKPQSPLNVPFEASEVFARWHKAYFGFDDDGQPNEDYTGLVFEKREYRHFKNLVKKLRHSMAQRKYEVNRPGAEQKASFKDEEVLNAFSLFLERFIAVGDKWTLNKYFSPSMLDSKYNEIHTIIISKRNVNAKDRITKQFTQLGGNKWGIA